MEQLTYMFAPIASDEYFSLVDSYRQSSFYNSPERNKFLASQKRKVNFFAIKVDGKTRGVVAYQKVPAKSGAFIYFQHSPILEDSTLAQDIGFWKALSEFARSAGRREGVLYARMTPRILESSEVNTLLEQAGFEKAPVQEVDACVTRVIDLESFSKRQLSKEITEAVKKADVSELTFEAKQDKAALESFMMLYKKVMPKLGSALLPFDYMKAELETYLNAGKLIIGLLHDAKGTVFAGNAIVLGNGNKMSWHYWTTTTDKGKEMGCDAKLLLETIQELKKNGFTTLDLWGEAVSEDIYKKKVFHPWLKIDKFKQGFGSKLVEYVQPIDIAINPGLYRASSLYQRFSMGRRGYPFVELEDEKSRK